MAETWKPSPAECRDWDQSLVGNLNKRRLFGTVPATAMLALDWLLPSRVHSPTRASDPCRHPADFDGGFAAIADTLRNHRI